VSDTTPQDEFVIVEHTHLHPYTLTHTPAHTSTHTNAGQEN